MSVSLERSEHTVNKVFPTELKAYSRNPLIKKVFVSDVEPTGALDCYNCGGIEVIAVFLALKGPFQSPGAPGMKEGEHYLTSHWDETVIPKGGWWVGKTITFPCPVCLGDLPQKPVRQYETQNVLEGIL